MCPVRPVSQQKMTPLMNTNSQNVWLAHASVSVHCHAHATTGKANTPVHLYLVVGKWFITLDICVYLLLFDECKERRKILGSATGQRCFSQKKNTFAGICVQQTDSLMSAKGLWGDNCSSKRLHESLAQIFYLSLLQHADRSSTFDGNTVLYYRERRTLAEVKSPHFGSFSFLI